MLQMVCPSSFLIKIKLGCRVLGPKDASGKLIAFSLSELEGKRRILENMNDC